MDLTPYHRFVSLVQFDQGVVAHQKKIAKLQQLLTQLEQECRIIADTHTQVEVHLHDLRKERDMRELEVKSAIQELTQKTKKLDTTADAKTCAALEIEISVLKERIGKIEEEVFALWQQIEEQEKTASISAQTCAEQERDCVERREKAETEVEDVRKMLKTLELRRPPYTDGIPAEWLTTYDAMRAKYADPVVFMAENSCSGCGFPVPSGDRSTIFRHVLTPCQQCRRLLLDPHILNEITSTGGVTDE